MYIHTNCEILIGKSHTFILIRVNVLSFKRKFEIKAPETLNTLISDILQSLIKHSIKLFLKDEMLIIL